LIYALQLVMPKRKAGVNSMEKMLKEVTERLSIFENLYTYIRIVDPEKKEAHMSKEDGSCSPATTCYAFWNRHVPCENCVSMRALEEKRVVSKIELAGQRTFFVQAIPTEVNNHSFIVEMFKDITEDQILLFEEQGAMELHEYIRVVNAKLVTDELTGLFNRRFISERLPADLYQAKLHNQSISIIMADIDHFKKINDTYGHMVGDCVLKEMAVILQKSIQDPLNWAARYGGEEFMMVLRFAEKNEVLQTVEQLRKKIQEHTFVCNDKMLYITCSFGVNFIHDNNSTVTKAIEDADQNLYKAKASGRNRTVAE